MSGAAKEKRYYLNTLCVFSNMPYSLKIGATFPRRAKLKIRNHEDAVKIKDL